jgi:hypothetical protein
MPPLPNPAYRLDVWTDTVAAGGTRVAFLVDPGGRAAMNVVRTRHVQPARSELSCTVAPDYPSLAALTPQAAVLRLTRFVATAPDVYTEEIEEWRLVRRKRVVRDAVGVYALVAVPLEDDLLDSDVFRTIGDGGLASWRYGAVDRTPAQVLQDLADRAAELGMTWIEVGTVTPTTPVSIDLQAPTPRQVIDALRAALAAKGVVAEFQLTLAGDLSAYRLELVTQVASGLTPLVVTTGQNARELDYDEDALEQATVVVPFGEDGIDLREFQCRAAAIDGGTGWITLEALDGTSPVLVAVDGQYTGKRLFRELTGRSFAITDASANPQRVRIAVADLASGLAVGERLSFRETEDNAGTRRYVTHAEGEVPVQVVSTLTSPNRIRTRVHGDLGGGNWITAANQLRDWTAERSQLIASLPSGTLDVAAGTFVLDSAPAATPAVGDWLLWHQFYSLPVVEHVFFNTPCTVTGYDAGTRTITFVPRYGGTQLQLTSGPQGDLVYLFRPVGTPMTILASAVTNNELTVDALPGPAFAATDVLEIWQRCQGTRLVELPDPTAIAAGRRKLATVSVPDCSGATNRVINGDFAAWAGGSGDPPDGFTITSLVGTVTRTRISAPEYTRYGGYSWKLDFAAGASGEVFSPLIPIHPVRGAEEVAAAATLLFTRFTGRIPLVVTLYTVAVSGVRTPLGEPVRVYPLDTTVKVDDRLKAALETWYDAAVTNRAVGTLRAEVLQLGIARPPGAANPACTVYLDAVTVLHRSGLPATAEGGVRWEFGSTATAMVAAAHDVLLDRAAPLVRYRAQLLLAPHEAVVGRTVSLRVPAFALTRTVRLVATREDLDARYVGPEGESATVLEGELERYRPDVARLLAPARAPVPAPPVTPLPSTVPSLEVRGYEIDADTWGITWDGAPEVALRIDGGLAAAPPASPFTVARNPSTGAAKTYRFVASNGLTQFDKVETVLVQPKAYIPPSTPVISDIAIANVDAPGDGGGEFDLDITVASMPGTEVYKWYAAVLSGDPISGGAADDDSGTLVIGDFPILNISGCQMAPGAQLQIRVDAEVAGVVIATKTATFTV